MLRIKMASSLRNNVNSSFYHNVAEDTESLRLSINLGHMKKIEAISKETEQIQIKKVGNTQSRKRKDNQHLRKNNTNQKIEHKMPRKNSFSQKIQPDEETSLRQNIFQAGDKDLKMDKDLSKKNDQETEHQIIPKRKRGPNKKNRADEIPVSSKVILQSGESDVKLNSGISKMTVQEGEINEPPRRRGRPKNKTQSFNESPVKENLFGLDDTDLQLIDDITDMQSISRSSKKTNQDKYTNKLQKQQPKEFQENKETPFDQNISRLDDTDLTRTINKKDEEKVEPKKRGRKKKIQASEEIPEIPNISTSDHTDLQLLKPNNKARQKKGVNVKKTVTPKVKKKLKSSTGVFPKPPPSNTLQDMIDIWDSVESDKGKNNEKETRKKNTKLDNKEKTNLEYDVHDIHISGKNNKPVGKRRVRKSYKYDRSKTGHQKTVDNEMYSASQNETNSNSVTVGLLKTENSLKNIETNFEPEKITIDKTSASNQVKQELLEQQKYVASETENKENTDDNNITNSSLNKENESDETNETSSEINSNTEKEVDDTKETIVDTDESDSDWRELFAEGSTDAAASSDDYEFKKMSAQKHRRASKIIPTPKPEEPALPKDISQLDLRVGIIRQVVEHVLSRRYWIPYVGIGEKKERAAIPNLRPHYERRSLKGKRVVVVCNIRTTVKKLDADSIILYATSGENHELLEAPEDCQVGDRISVEGFPFTPDPKHRFIHPMREGLRVIHEVMKGLRVDGEGRAEYQGIPLRTEKGDFLKAKTLRDCLIGK